MKEKAALTFEQAKIKAESYVQHKDKLLRLLEKATRKSARCYEFLLAPWESMQIFLRLLRAQLAGKFCAPAKSILMIVAIVCILCMHLTERQNELQAQEVTPKIQVTVNAVLVPVVARDSKGRAVGSLKKQNFEIFDEGRPQEISGFTVEEHGVVQRDRVKPTPAIPGIASTHSTAPERFIVFLFDDLHLGAGDLMQIQDAATKMLADSLDDSDVAAVVSISGMNSGLTRDRGKLQEAILNLKTHAFYQNGSTECPNVDFYHADLIQNKNDDAALEDAAQEALTCAHLDARTMHEQAQRMARSAASRSMAIGEHDSRVTLDIVRELVHRMSALQGERRLIFVSPGFLTLTEQASSEKSQILDLASQSNVTISALDARGLYSTELDASNRGASSARDLQTGSTSQVHRASMALGENVMAELPDGTGGTYFHNNNDLKGGFRQLAAAPEYLYLLQFSLENSKQDDRYHRLTVKVDQEGLQLQARRGYFAAKPMKTKK